MKIQGSLMDDINEGVSLEKTVPVRIDNIDQISNQSTFINYLQRLGRLRDRLQTMNSLGYIENYNWHETDKKKE